MLELIFNNVSMSNKELKRKLIHFSDNDKDFENIYQDMKNGWHFTYISNNNHNNNYYLGIMELTPNQEENTLFIPPRKRIQIRT